MPPRDLGRENDKAQRARQRVTDAGGALRIAQRNGGDVEAAKKALHKAQQAFTRSHQSDKKGS